MQADVLQLWDPSRSKTILGGYGGGPQDWRALQSLMETQNVALQAAGGEGLFVLMRESTSPTLAAQLDQLRLRYPRASLHVYEPLGAEQRAAGTQIAFGRALDTLYHFDRADVVLSLDAVILQGLPVSLR
jgi:molybdopterin-containing oxidoreductase family iron-sulfur binding subunit